MKRVLKVTLYLMLSLAVLMAVVLGIAAMSGVPHEGASLVINDESFTVDGLGGFEWLITAAAMLVAGVVVAVVVPMALLIGLGIPALLAALALCLGLLVAGAAITLVLSPLLLIGALLWWALRKRKPAKAPGAAPGSITIAS